MINDATVRNLVGDLVEDYRGRVDENVVTMTVTAAVDFLHALYLDDEPGALDVLRIAVRHRLDAGVGGLGRRSPRLYGIRQRRRDEEPESDEVDELYDAV